MDRRWYRRGTGQAGGRRGRTARLVTDGGEDTDGAADGDETGDAEERHPSDGPVPDHSNVEVSEADEVEPADPKWERPDLDEIPEFEVGVEDPVARHGGETPTGGAGSDDPTAGMPNTARSPGDSRIKREGTEGYVAALELCARLPEDVRLPEEAADLVPAAVEAELEGDVQSFAAAEFDNPSPHVDVLEFVDRDGDIWLRLRLGIPAEAFADLDPEEVRSHALQELEGLL